MITTYNNVASMGATKIIMINTRPPTYIINIYIHIHVIIENCLTGILDMHCMSTLIYQMLNRFIGNITTNNN